MLVEMGSDEDREDDYFEAGMQVAVGWNDALGKMERFGHFHFPVSDDTIFMHIYLNVYRYTS